MATIAIIGAGEIGGAVASALASRDCVGRILIVDPNAKAAAGKALDIQQAGAIQQFHTRLDSTDDETRIVTSSVCVVADRFGQPPVEWNGEAGLSLVMRIAPYLDDVPIVFAGPSQSELLIAAAKEAGISRRRLIGSSSEALAAAARAIVAVEAHCSPEDVLLSVLGIPPRFVIPWSDATIAGYALERVLTQVALARVAARVDRLWPPGPFALGTAAARIAGAIVETSRRSFNVLTVLSGEFGVRGRVGALSAMFAAHGIAHTREPSLNTRERVQLETALGV